MIIFFRNIHEGASSDFVSELEELVDVELELRKFSDTKDRRGLKNIFEYELIDLITLSLLIK